MSADRWNLHAIWREEGAHPERRPEDWAKLPEAVGFIAHIMRTEGPPGQAPFQAGAHGDLWAHWQIGMPYRQWASPAFAARCAEAFGAHIERRGMSLGDVIGGFLEREPSRAARGADVLPFGRREAE
jgi:hypothetical protein